MSELEVALGKTPNLGIIHILNDGIINFINKKFEEIFALSTKRYLGKNFSSLALLDSDLEQIYNCLNTTNINLYESKFLIIKRQNLYFRATISNVLQNAKTLSGFIVTLVDITNEKRLEEEQIYKDRLLIQNGKMAVVGEMINSISHQQRQPLSSVMLGLDDIAECVQEQNFDDIDLYVKRCKKGIRLLDETINAFRSFYKNDDEISVFDVRDIIDELCFIVRANIATNGILLKWSCEDEELMIKTASSYLKQALLALLSNAKDELAECIKTMDIQPEICLNIKKIANEICISVSDNGRGFKAFDDRIYESFYTTKDNGTGMGLYIAKHLVCEKMGGRLQLQSLKNPTKFCIYLKSENR